MTIRSIIGALGAGALVVTLWGCGSAAPSKSAAPPSAPVSAAVASAAEPSAAAPSQAGSSIAIPSFSLPSDAKDLEALLPSTMCGGTATKASVSGSNLGQSVDPQFLAALQALGKSQSDVAFAFAFAQGGCTAGIFRIAGVDSGALQSTLLAEEQKSGTTYTQGTVGGKSVYISSASSSAAKQYVYFHGDAVIFAQAPDEAKAATILQALP